MIAVILAAAAVAMIAAVVLVRPRRPVRDLEAERVHAVIVSLQRTLREVQP